MSILKTDDKRANYSKLKNGSYLKGQRYDKEFAMRLRLLREKLGLSQESLAKKLGVSITALQNWEAGQLPKGSHLKMLGDLFDVSIDWLLFGEGPMYRREKYREKIIKVTKKIDFSVVKDVVQVVEEFLHEEKIYLSPPKKAELISLLLEETEEYGQKPNEERVLRLIKLAS